MVSRLILIIEGSVSVSADKLRPGGGVGCGVCSCTAKYNTENSKQIFPEKELRGLSPNFHIHVSVSYWYIPRICLPILCRKICGPILVIYKSLTDTWGNWDDAAQFLFWEYINGIFFAVCVSVTVVWVFSVLPVRLQKPATLKRKRHILRESSIFFVIRTYF